MRRALIVVGLAIAAVGLAWPWLGRLGLGRLPGDIYVRGERRLVLFSHRHLHSDQRRAVARDVADQSLTGVGACGVDFALFPSHRRGFRV